MKTLSPSSTESPVKPKSPWYTPTKTPTPCSLAAVMDEELARKLQSEEETAYKWVYSIASILTHAWTHPHTHTHTSDSHFTHTLGKVGYVKLVRERCSPRAKRRQTLVMIFSLLKCYNWSLTKNMT